MSFDPDIANLRMRIAKAESNLGRWRTSGNQEKYLENYALVEALELELDGLRRQRIDTAKRSASYPRDERAPQPPAAHAESPANAVKGERERLMEELSITFAGRQYQYSHYRYDRLDDAIAYARKQRAAPSASDAADSLPPARIEEAPDELQRRRMVGNGITFEEGVYRLGEYRYDRLADAMRHARLQIAGKLEGIRAPRASLF